MTLTAPSAIVSVHPRDAFDSSVNVPIHLFSLEEIIRQGITPPDKKDGVRRISVRAFPSVLDTGFDDVLSRMNLVKPVSDGTDNIVFNHNLANIKPISVRQRLVTKLGVEVFARIPEVEKFGEARAQVMNDFHPARRALYMSSTSYEWGNPAFVMLKRPRVDVTTFTWVYDAISDLQRTLGLPMSTLLPLIIMAGFGCSTHAIHPDLISYCNAEIACFREWVTRTQEDKYKMIKRWPVELGSA